MKFVSIVILFSLFASLDVHSQSKIKFTPVSSKTTSILPKPVSAESPLQNRYTSVTNIFKEGDTYYLLYNDLVGGWPASKINIALAASKDLETWELIETPILTSENLPFDFGEIPSFIFATSLVKKPKGGYLLYFDVLAKDVNKGIGVATSENLTGPWKVHPEMILEPDLNSWDKYAVTSSDVIYFEGDFIMYYSGVPTDGVNSENGIMRATSKDGINWERGRMPVFRKNINPDLFDSHKVENVQVLVADNQWIMVYRTDNGDGTWGGNSAYGMAKSWDGITWQRVQNEPILSENDVQNWMTIWAFALLKEGDTFHIFLEYDGPPLYATRINHSIYQESAQKITIKDD